jgi:hypothetical protein
VLQKCYAAVISTFAMDTAEESETRAQTKKGKTAVFLG